MKVMCWRMCLYGCFVLGIVRTWEVVSALRKVPRNLGSGVGKVPRFRYAFVWRSSEGVRGNLRAGPTGIRCDALAIRRLGLLRTKTKKTARSTHGERHHGRCARPRQPITLHPRRGCAKRKPSRTISRPESRHSCTTSQTTSATGPRKRRFSNAPTRKR